MTFYRMDEPTKVVRTVGNKSEPDDTLDPDIALWQEVPLSIWPFAGAPTTGTWPKGWLGIDNTSTLYVCTLGGTPGTWAAVAGALGTIEKITSSGGTIDVANATGPTTNLEVDTAHVVTSFDTRSGAVVLVAADVEGLFTAASQVFLGTGSGTGSLTDILTALEGKFSAAGQLIAGTGSATGELLTGPTVNGTVLQKGGADASGLEWASVQVVTTVFTSNAYTLAITDANTHQKAGNGSTAATVTVPAHASVAFPVGTVITFKQDGSGKISIAAAGGVTIQSSVSGGFVSGTTGCRAQDSTIGLLQEATDSWVMSGDAA